MAEYMGDKDWSAKKEARVQATEAKADFRAGLKHLAEHHKEVRREMEHDMMKKKDR